MFADMDGGASAGVSPSTRSSGQRRTFEKNTRGTQEEHKRNTRGIQEEYKRNKDEYKNVV